MTKPAQPYALFIRGAPDDIFNLADQMGFESEMEALAVSIFEDGPNIMHVQALFDSHNAATNCLAGLAFPTTKTESFITQLPNEDWVAKSQKGLPPVHAGRFFIYGDHDKDNIPSEANFPIHIDAGLAFGTGHHGTTKGCLLIFDDLIKDGLAPLNALDLGCGAGILSIAYAKALGAPILATDMDADAVNVTRDNSALNHVSPFIDAHLSEGFAHHIFQQKKFDFIFANILAGPLMNMAKDISAHMSAGGHIILSGILTPQSEDVKKAFQTQGLIIISQRDVEGWTSLLAQKSAA